MSFTGTDKIKPLGNFELRQWNISIEDCRTDNVAYHQVIKGEVPTLDHWKNVLQNAVRDDLKNKDANGSKILPTRQHIEDIKAEKSRPGSIWSGSSPLAVRRRYQARHDYEVEKEKRWNFEGMEYTESRLRFHGQLVTPIEISYNLILAAHVGGGEHLGRIPTYAKLKKVTQSIKQMRMVAKFIEGCPNIQCRNRKVNAGKKRVHIDTENFTINSKKSKRVRLSHRELESKPQKSLYNNHLSENSVGECEAFNTEFNVTIPEAINFCEIGDIELDGVNDYDIGFSPEIDSPYWSNHLRYDCPDPELTFPTSASWQELPCQEYPDPEI